MKPGYHTSALSEHDLGTACALLRQLGFRSQAVRLSLSRLDPLAEPEVRQLQLAPLVDACRESMLVIDADGPYLIDPWSAAPIGLSGCGPEQERRIEYLIATIEMAAEIGSPLVTFSVGPDSVDGVAAGVEGESGEGRVQRSLDRLADVVLQLVDRAETCGVRLAIRPRCGHFVDSLGRFERLVQWMGGNPLVQLAADVGAMVVGGEMPVADLLGRVQQRLACVYFSELHLADQQAISRRYALGATTRVLEVEGEGEAAEFEAAWIGPGHVSALRVAQGLESLGYHGPVVLEPIDSGGNDPGLARLLYEWVFHRVIFTK